MAEPTNVASSVFDAPVSTVFNRPPPKGKAPKKSKIAALVANSYNPAAAVAQPHSYIEPLAAAAEANALTVSASQPSFLERAGAARMGSTDQRLAEGFGRLMRGYSAEFDSDAVIGYKAPDSAFIGASEDEMQERAEARSDAELNNIVGRQESEKQRIADLMSGGLVSGFGLAIGAEIFSISGMASGYGAARLGTMLELARASKLGAAGRSVAINVTQGTALEASAQLLEQRYDPINLGLSAVTDIAVGGTLGHFEYKAALGKLDTQRALEDAVIHEATVFDRARANLSDGAAPEYIEAEYQRIIHKELSDPIVSDLTPTGNSRKLMDHPDDIEADEIAQEAALAAKTADTTSTASLAGPEPLREAPLRAEDIKPAVSVRQAMADALESPALKVVTETSRATRHLLTHLQSIVPDRVQDDVLVDFMGDVRGAYNVARNDISAPGTSSTALQPSGWAGRNDANILAHEVVHAATGRLIAAVRDNVPGVSAGSVAAVRRLESIRLDLDAQLKAAGIRNVKRSAGADYAAGDLDEFVAQVMSDVETRKVLASMPAKGFDNMLSKFADAVVRLLGLDPKTTSTALQEAVSLVEKIIKEGEVPTGANAATWIKSKPGLAPTGSPIAVNPIAVKYGLTNLPTGTVAETSKAKALINLYTKADAWAARNPKDAAWDARTANLVDNSLFNAASTSLNMLKSNNPLVRMIASELLEDPSGAAGARKSTAAISKYTHERLFMGNTINDMQNAYAVWGKQYGNTVKDDYFGGGTLRARFDKEVASEIESRRVNGNLTQDPHIKAAADSIEAAYERMRKAQISNKTLGWAAMPKTSKGYMPHRISPSKWRQTNNDQRMVIRDALAEQYANISGWDSTFSSQLADRVLERVHARANGGYDSPIGGNSSGSAEIIQDAMLTMGMTADEVRKNMMRFNRGAATWTKGRIDLDLNRTFHTASGDYKLIDIFDTDQLSLLRSQAGRASGEVALARHGVYGKPGLTLLREAMTYGDNAGRATDTELGAFDQVSAEFLSAPFGDAGPKWMERARVANSVVRLGGIAFNQFAELANAITHIGVVRTFKAIKDFPRLRKEIVALSKGQQVGNNWLDSMERIGGAEFGTDAYKIIMPFDSMDHAYPTYGRDTLGVADRLLRGASHAQAKLSLWRAIHSVQQRGMAEQITAKIARYVRDGTDDVALEQFGITPQVRAALKRDLANVAKWDGDSLVEFDVTRMTDLDMQEELIQSVHRGVSQIIQGTFIGETGKWAHDGYLKVLTQFRTFSITSMEKQWARQRNSRGTAQALGVLLGSMSVVVPVYVARVYASSVGRPDAEEYIEKRLAPEMVARQTLNYVAMAGLTGDVFDIAAAVLPESWGVNMTGGRAGTDTKFVGNVVAPSLSLADDVWKGLQNLDDPEKLAKLLPGSRLPFLLPAINALGD